MVPDFKSEAWVYVHAIESGMYFRRSVMPEFDKEIINTGMGPKSILKETQPIELQKYIKLNN